ncbi:transformer-2 protein [Cryptococcus deuterogattii LA55]|nr:transformer-2 protein [Cryptococcus deuterogattii LA55]
MATSQPEPSVAPPRDSYDERAASPPPRDYAEDKYSTRPPPAKYDDEFRDDSYSAKGGDTYRNDRPAFEAPRRPAQAPPPVNPNPVLGVFGLSIRTRERDLEDEFMRYGDVEKVVIVYDQRTDRSRGFGFITMRTTEDAARCIEKLNGLSLHGRNIRVDYSATQKPHSSTPGQYMGAKRPIPTVGGAMMIVEEVTVTDVTMIAVIITDQVAADMMIETAATGKTGDPYEGRSRRDDYGYDKYDKHDKYADYDYDKRSSRRSRYSASPARSTAAPAPEVPRY